MPEVEIESTELVPTGLEDQNTDTENTEEQQAAVKRCSDWFQIDKTAKDNYVAEMDENDKLRVNKHWDLLGPSGVPLRTPSQQAMHPNSVENVVQTLVEGQVAEFAQALDLVDFPEEDSDDLVATVLTDLKQAIAYKNRIDVESMKWNRNFFWHGTGVWKHVWDPHWKGGVGPNRWLGEVRWQSRHPRLVFPDARCGDDIHQGRRIHDARYVTKEYIREKFPECGSLAQDGVLDTTLLSSADEDTTVDAQLGQVLLVETWYIGTPLIKDKKEKRKGIGLNCIWWAGETNPVYLGHANYLYFPEGKDPKFPFTFRARYPRDNSPWGYGEAYFLKQCQIMLNKTSDIIMEGHIHNVLGQTLYTEDALNPEQKKMILRTGTLAGMWNEVQDVSKITRLYGSSVPASVQNEMNRLRGAMENITGRFDVTMGRTPGSVTAFKALALLDQRAQVRLRSADVAIRTAYEEVGSYINELIPQYYTEQRAYRIVGTNSNGQFEVKKRGVFKLEEVQKAHFYEDGKVVPLVQRDAQGNVIGKTDLTAFGKPGEDETQTPPVEGPESEGGDYEVFVPEMDVKCRTTATMPSERMFYMEMAKELLGAGAIDMQIFFYVIENGRFPPWSTIGKQVAERMAQLKAAQPQQGTGSGNIPAGSRITITSQVKDPAKVQAMLNQLNGWQSMPNGGANNPVLQQFLDNLSPEEAQAIMEMAGNNPNMIQELINMDPNELQALLQHQEQQQGPREWTAGGEPGGPQAQPPKSA